VATTPSRRWNSFDPQSYTGDETQTIGLLQRL